VRSPFERILSKAAEHAASDKWPFRKGDSAHLARWLGDGRADEIWQKLYPGPFDSRQASSFIIKILSLRQLAEQLDHTKKISDAKRARKKAAAGEAVKQLTELSAQGFVIRNVREGALDSLESLEPFLAVRSDKHGTRRHTIFCRLASNLVRADAGHWHDEEVEALCQIAFNCEAVDVRSAREAGRRDATRNRKRKA
jgi:hypothetical protein